MTTTFIVNGKLQLALTPSNNLEKEMLLQLCAGPIEVIVHDKVQIADKALQDTAIITTKTPTDGK